MAFGEFIAELLVQFAVEVIFEGFIKGVLVPVLRFPGVCITGLFHGGNFQSHWNTPDTAVQVLLSTLFWVGVGVCVVLL